jgi:glycerol-3-phosphate acyltransferase PlsY
MDESFVLRHSSHELARLYIHLTFEIWHFILAALIGYLFGSVPSGVIVSRAVARRDPRRVGSGHTGGLNTARTIGWFGFFLAGIPDVMKGLAAVALVQRFITPSPWAAVMAGAAAVAGHCWSVYIGFRGGMGVGTSSGLMLWFCPLVVPVMIALWALLRLTVIRHTAQSAAMAMLAAGPLTWLFGGTIPIIVLATSSSAILLLRYLSDWKRVYKH